MSLSDNRLLERVTITLMSLDAQPTIENVSGPLGAPSSSDVQPKKDANSEPIDSVKSAVRQWNKKINDDKRHFQADFDRMRTCMDFVANYQWNSQQKSIDDRYIANFTIRAINQKVATLYARNPKVVATRRQRLDFRMWDGKMESIMQALQAAMMSMQQLGVMPPEASALLQDYQQGKTVQQLVDRIGKTLEIVFQYQLDSQQPDFKTQAKQFVRRAAVCGVAYLKVIFCRDYEHNDLTQSETRQSVTERVQRAKLIMDKISEGKIDMDDAQVETLKSLVASMGMSPSDHESVAVKERLIFDFPPATSIIPDRRCRMLKGFVGAHHLTEEYFYPLDFVNAMFETEIKPGGELKHYDQKGNEITQNAAGVDPKDLKDDPSVKPIVCIRQVWDLDTKSTFLLCDGYNDYVMEPEPMTPATKSFWVHFPLTFNDIETEPGCKTTIFPPTDVQLLMPMQKEWNRTRQALREQRKANAPKYMCPKGALSDGDKDNIENAEDNQVIELENIQPNQDPGTILKVLQVAKIDSAVYDTQPLQEDSLLASGQQEANVGPAQPNVTATVGSIAEQSRMTVAASNVDDLDDCLTAATSCGGEMLLREMSKETVIHIAGMGSVWPEQNREDFLNQIELVVQAASSGRPNKAISIDNWTKVMPLIMQAASMPPEMQTTAQACIRETIKRLDEPNLDPSDFYPTPMAPQQPQQSQQQPQSQPQGNPPKQKRIGPPSTNGQQQMHPVPTAGQTPNRPQS